MSQGAVRREASILGAKYAMQCVYEKDQTSLTWGKQSADDDNEALIRDLSICEQEYCRKVFHPSVYTETC